MSKDKTRFAVIITVYRVSVRIVHGFCIRFVLAVSRNAKNKYNVLLLESDSYKRSVEEESTRNNGLRAMSRKLKQEQDSLQYNFKAYFDMITTAKEKHFDSLQIIELQEHNLEQVILVRF